MINEILIRDRNIVNWKKEKGVEIRKIYFQKRKGNRKGKKIEPDTKDPHPIRLLVTLNETHTILKAQFEY